MRRWALAGGNHPAGHGLRRWPRLVAQGGAYTLETISPAGEHRCERITSIKPGDSVCTPDLTGP